MATSLPQKRKVAELDPDSVVESREVSEQFYYHVTVCSEDKATKNDPKSDSLSSAVVSEKVKAPSPELKPNETHDDSSMGNTVDSEQPLEQPILRDQPSIDSTVDDSLHRATKSESNHHFQKVEYPSKEQPFHDEFPHLPWLESLEVAVMRKIVSPSGKTSDICVGGGSAKLIKHNMVKTRFYEEMRKPSTEVALLAFDLFDHRGKFKTEYIHSQTKKGSAAWQHQFEDRDVLLIEDILVEDPGYLRQGIGSKMIEALLEVVRSKTKDQNFVVVMWPEPTKYAFFKEARVSIIGNLGDIHKDRILSRRHPIAMPWARRNGFSRIGSSIWFGLEVGNKEVKQIFPVLDDYDPPVYIRPAGEPLSSSICELILPKQCLRADSERDKEFLKALQHEYANISTSDPRWLACDKEGNNMLHLAALYFHEQSLTWILQQNCAQQLRLMQNSSGHTPVQALEQALEAKRTRELPLSGNTIVVCTNTFNGHSLEIARCLAMLEDSRDDTDDNLQRLRYGCTCGVCDYGYLSLHMHKKLWRKADFYSFTLGEDIDRLSGPAWAEENAFYIEDVSSHLAKYLTHYKSMRKAFVQLCEDVGKCMLSDLPPTEENILSIAKSDSKRSELLAKYHKGGGTIEEVMKLIFLGMWADDEYGIDPFEDDSEDEDFEQLTCRNDHEYALMARNCGWPRIAAWFSKSRRSQMRVHS